MNGFNEKRFRPQTRIESSLTILAPTLKAATAQSLSSVTATGARALRLVIFTPGERNQQQSESASDNGPACVKARAGIRRRIRARISGPITAPTIGSRTITPLTIEHARHVASGLYHFPCRES